MKHSWVTKALETVIHFLEGIGIPSSVLIPLKLPHSILVILETNPRAWRLIAPHWEIPIPVIALVIFIRHTSYASPSIPIAFHLFLPILFVVYPLFRAIR